MRRLALFLFELTRGAIGFSDVLEMEVGEIDQWLEDAVDLRREITKARGY